MVAVRTIYFDTRWSTCTFSRRFEVFQVVLAMMCVSQLSVDAVMSVYKACSGDRTDGLCACWRALLTHQHVFCSCVIVWCVCVYVCVVNACACAYVCARVCLCACERVNESQDVLLDRTLCLSFATSLFPAKNITRPKTIIQTSASRP